MKKIEKLFILTLILRAAISIVLVPGIIKLLPYFLPKDLEHLILRNMSGFFWSLLHLVAIFCLILGLMLLLKRKTFKINNLLRFSVYYYSSLYFILGTINIATTDFSQFFTNADRQDFIIFIVDYLSTMFMVIVVSILFSTKQTGLDAPKSLEVSNVKKLRLINFVLDIFVIIFLAFSVRVKIADNLGLVIDSNLTILVVSFFYYFFMELVYSQTIGKLITGTSVYCERKHYFIGIINRTLTRFIPFEALSFLDKKNKGWHDRFSNTGLIKTTPN